jgi:site-specific DNA-methyltransferase (adenine-specific)
MGKDWDAPWKGKASREFNDVEPGTLGGFTKLPNHTRVNNVKCQTCDKWKFSSNPCICETPTFTNARLYAASAFQTWSEQWAREALRVLKPGGYLLAFGGTRMYHRLAAGIEDAGFEIRDTLMWLYGSGFPKSLDVSKAIDKAAGAEREVVGKATGGGFSDKTIGTIGHSKGAPDITAPSTEAAKKWQGWGTALKPAVEPIVLARKPLIGTVAANVLTHGTGALNIDASRIGIAQGDEPKAGKRTATFGTLETTSGGDGSGGWNASSGRWPANILLDEEAAAMLDQQSGERPTGEVKPYTRDSDNRVVYNSGWGNDMKFEREASSGGASRFFYVAKASRSERNAGLHFAEKNKALFAEQTGLSKNGDGSPRNQGQETRNIHPTVKPVALMKYLIRLVVPKGGVVLDPFLGSGTTAVAAIEEGVEWIGCEREPEYVEIIKARVAAAQPGMGLTLEGER